MKINVHAGHNSYSTGANKYLNENTENRKVKTELIRLLKAEGHTIYDCTDDAGKTENQNLINIVNKCNAHTVDLDVSIHLNAGGGTGVEVWIYDKTSNSPVAIADRIAKKVSSALGIANRGVKVSGNNLYVLRETKAPALLVECCFVDSQTDKAKWNATKCAKAIAEAILNKSISGSAPSKPSKPNKPSTPSAKTYKIVKTINGYVTAADAKAHKNAKTTVKAGTYYVFNEDNGMVNVTSQKGKAGSWINPADNKVSTSGGSSNSLPKDFVKEDATFTVTVSDGIVFRNEPSLKAKITGSYSKGQSVNYEGYVVRDGFVWITWISASAKVRRWMPVRETETNKAYGTFK